jgi:molybdenum cofactor synthesis domain-containing protein
MSTACVIIIGNEILSGRTQDTNLAWLAVELNKAGVRLREARVVPDVPAAIVKAVNECRAEYDYIFTTGGIGPTHDDITSECIAQAFGVPYERNEEAYQLLFNYYGAEKLNEARLRMCNMPRGARLIPNPVSIAPGYAVENVHVMAGVPRIMQAMFDYIRPTLTGGKPMQSETVSVFLTEGTIARALTEVQEHFPDIEIGSYPFVRDGKLGTSLVARGEDESRLQMAKDAIIQMVKGFNGELAGESQEPTIPM